MPRNLTEMLDALARVHPKKIDLGLARIERVLNGLGRPQDRLPPVIHVAGTNGKGSTIAYLHAMAKAQNKRVHVYTSPHLVHFNERLIVAGEPISDKVLQAALERVQIANGDAPLSFFEAITAAMFLVFSEIAADIAIIEVGLGGRYDATNIVLPICTLISAIGYDHAEFLGHDLTRIAYEKAGIFKSGCPAIIGAQSEQVATVLKAEAQKCNASFKQWGQEYYAYVQNGRLVYEEPQLLLDLPRPALCGAHQITNAGLAVAAACELGWSSKTMAQGLEMAVWPARLQNLQQGKLAEKVTERQGELWLDGGHNPHAARALRQYMVELETLHKAALVIIIGMLKNKDAPGFLEAFSGLACGVVVVPVEDHEAWCAEALYIKAQTLELAIQGADTIESGLDKALELTAGMKQQPRILICGSLYLAGEVLRLSQ